MNHYRGRGGPNFPAPSYPGRGNYGGVPPPPLPPRGRGFPPPFRGGGPFRPPYPGMPPYAAPPPPVHLPPPPIQLPRPMPPMMQHPPVAMRTAPLPNTTATALVHPPQPAPFAAARQQTVGDWVIHTPQTGATYYYNTITKRSQFEVPDALRKATTWTEYKDSSTGKSYYSNGVSTTWERPCEMDAAPGVQGADADSSTAESKGEPVKKKPKLDIPKLDQPEAVERFKKLLEKHAVAPNVKYPDVQKQMKGDIMWQACEDALTIGNRKQLLAEYQTKRSNELKKQTRELSLAAKANFIAILHEQKIPIDGHWELLESKVVDRMERKGILTAQERKVLFLEYCEDVRKRNERKKRNEKRIAMEKYSEYLQSQLNDGFLQASSGFPSTPLDGTLNESERKGIFGDFIQTLKCKERSEAEDRLLREQDLQKASRLKMVAALKALADAEKIVPASPWNMVQSLLSDEVYRNVAKIDISLPERIFRDFCAQWSENYRRDRAVLSRLLPDELHRSMEYKEFAKQLKDAANAKHVRIDTIFEESDSAYLYFRELTGRLNVSAISKQRDESSEDEGEVVEDDESDDNGNHAD